MGPPVRHPIRRRGTMQLGYLFLRCIVPLLCGWEICDSSRRALPLHGESGGDLHQGEGDDYPPAPIHNNYEQCLDEIYPVTCHLCGCVFLQGLGSAWDNGALFARAHTPGFLGWVLHGDDYSRSAING